MTSKCPSAHAAVTSTRTCSGNVVPSLLSSLPLLPSSLPPPSGREKSGENGKTRPLAPTSHGTPLARPNCAAAFSKRPEALAGELNSPSSSPEFASEPSDGSSSEGFPALAGQHSLHMRVFMGLRPSGVISAVAEGPFPTHPTTTSAGFVEPKDRTR